MRIGSVIKDWRYANRMGIREGATIIGVSPATLSRIENDLDVDGKTFIKLFEWLFVKGDATPVKQQKPDSKRPAVGE